MNPAEIQYPTLLVDRSRVIANVQRMLDKVVLDNISFRPHFKTHFSAAIGEWIRTLGINQITVSSIEMALYFAEHGWQDITIAFPINLRALQQVDKLAATVSLGITVDHIVSIKAIQKEVSHPLKVWIEIDTDDGRSGVPHEHEEAIYEMVTLIQEEPSHLQFEGLLTHSGHTYHSKSKEEITRIYEETLDRMTILKNALAKKGTQHIKLSMGDTPSASLMNRFTGFDELRPGNLVFYDVMQLEHGICKEDDIAVCLAVPVVSVHPEKGKIVVQGGGVHLSKDAIQDKEGKSFYGYVVSLTEKGWGQKWEDTRVESLSQEHGVIKTTRQKALQVKPGDLIGLLPVHSCMTADLQGYYITTDGETVNKMQRKKAP